MDIIDAIILGIIQGLTEFLPVSSSGHLELGKAILGDSTLPEESLLFTVVLHFATALSTLVVFRKDIFDIIKGLFQFKWNEESQFAVKIILSMIPAVLIGLFFEEQLESFKKAFDEFDLDGSGEIDASELNHLIKDLGLVRTPEEIDAMVLEVDEDGSGEIDFDEFTVMLAEIMMEDAGPEMIALMGGSKRRQMELKAQKKKDSGANIQWS